MPDYDYTMKILCVDDFSTMRRIVKNMLKQLGFDNIEEAENGSDAYGKLQGGDFKFVITDWNMPVMDGFELVKAVRQRPEWNEMRILMVTTENGVDEVVRAMRAGANEYLMKPFDIDDVRAKLALMGLV